MTSAQPASLVWQVEREELGMIVLYEVEFPESAFLEFAALDPECKLRVLAQRAVS